VKDQPANNGTDLLQQSFSLHRFLHLGPRGYPIKIGFDVWPFAKVDADPRRPAQHGEHVRVGDSECVAHQVLLASQLIVDQSKRCARYSREVFLNSSGVVGRKIGPNVLCNSEVMKLSHS
jgi:hypothetical protein